MVKVHDKSAKRLALSDGRAIYTDILYLLPATQAQQGICTGNILKRVVLMFRLIIPMMLISFLLVLTVQEIFLAFHLLLHPDIVSILGGAAIGIAGGLWRYRGRHCNRNRRRYCDWHYVYCMLFHGALSCAVLLCEWAFAHQSLSCQPQNPALVFSYLQKSSLYWDEIIYLPLPFLKQTLLIVYDEDLASDSSNHIHCRRKTSAVMGGASTTLKIALPDLKARKSLEQIAGA